MEKKEAKKRLRGNNKERKCKGKEGKKREIMATYRQTIKRQEGQMTQTFLSTSLG